MIHERQDHIVKEQQAFSWRGVADIGRLLGGDIQPLTENGPVTAGLIQQINKVAVLQNVLDFRGTQQVVG